MSLPDNKNSVKPLIEKKSKKTALQKLVKAAPTDPNSQGILDAASTPTSAAKVLEEMKPILEDMEANRDKRELGGNTHEPKESMDRLLRATAEVTDTDLLAQLENPTEEDLEITGVEEDEALLVMIYRYHSRGVPTKEMREKLGLTASKYQAVFRKMQRYVRNKLLEHDILYSVGDSIHFYQDMRAACMQIASKKGADDRTRLAAISMAVRVEGDKNQFMENTGLYDKAILVPIAAEVVTTQLKKSQLYGQNAGIVGDLTSDIVQTLADHASMVREQQAAARAAENGLEALLGDVPPIPENPGKVE